jgi:glycosyltransferase involved in cell wall biosynthesis
MRLLYVVELWPSTHATYLYREMRWMREHGHAVAVVSLGQGTGPGQANLTRYGLENMPALILGLRPSTGALIALMNALRIEMMDAHGGRDAGELACQAHMITGIPYALRLHGGDVHSAPSPALEHTLGHAAVICPVSPFLSRFLTCDNPPSSLPEGLPVKFDLQRMRICRHGVPKDEVALQPVLQSDNQVLIGTVGRLSPGKRQRDLLAAIAMLTPEFPQLRLRFIGGGELLSDLCAQAENLGIAARVEFTGDTTVADTLRLMQDFNIYVQTSQLEGFCLATLEAAARGLPLLASETGIHGECVESGENGYLFQSGDVQQLSRSLAKLIRSGRDARQRMGAMSLRIVRERFALEKLMSRLEALYNAVLAKAPLPI